MKLKSDKNFCFLTDRLFEIETCMKYLKYKSFPNII